MAVKKRPWEIWLEVAATQKVVNDITGMIKQSTGDIPWNCVDNIIKEFKRVCELYEVTDQVEINDPAAVYVAAHVSNHPEASITEVLMTSFSEQSLRDTKAILLKAGIDIDKTNRTGNNALKTTAQEL